MLLTKIRNGQKYKSFQISHPYSHFLFDVVQILYHQGYIRGYYVQTDKIFVLLKYINNQPVLRAIKRISKPSKKIYWSLENLKTVKYQGTFILSTNKGILSDKSSIQSAVGGELLVHVI
jgi:small subunit ribosomal protein S8